MLSLKPIMYNQRWMIKICGNATVVKLYIYAGEGCQASLQLPNKQNSAGKALPEEGLNILIDVDNFKTTRHLGKEL